MGTGPDGQEGTACAATATASPRLDLQRIELSAAGLFEAGAATPLTTGLADLSGVSKVIANPLTERVVVLFDPAVIGIDGIVRALGAQGADRGRSLARWHVHAAGLGCARCARRVEEAVGLVPGVRAAIVNRTAESLTVEFIPGRTDLGAVRAALLAQGFDPGPAPPSYPAAEGPPSGKPSP